MEFGVCTDTASARALAAAGFGFIELNVQAHLKPEAAESEFAGELRKIEASPLPCAAANCFIPSHLKITGPAVDKARLEAYVSTAMARAGRAGIRTIVFGSGGARQVPDGFDRARAWAQLVDFCGMAAPWAGRHGVTLVVEPLNKAECNVLTTVGEAGRLVRETGHPALRLLVDAYHWNKDGDSYDELVALGPLLGHAHIATTRARMAPGLEPADFGPFFDALRKGGYKGRVSVEGKWNDLAADAATVMRTLAEARAAAQ